MEAALQNEFFRGNHQRVIDRSLDACPPAWKRSDLPWIVGALTFLGRLEEAERLYLDNEKKLSESERVPCRFFLGIGLCRHSFYDRCRAYLDANLKSPDRKKSPGSEFYTQQGEGFYSYMHCDFAAARDYAREAAEAAQRCGCPYGKYLSIDLLGHSQVQIGEVSLGMRSLEEAWKHARKLGNGSSEKAVEISLACYAAQFGLSPSKDLRNLEKLYASTPVKNSFSQAALLLEMGRQHTLRGEVLQSDKILNEACRYIYASRHKRQGATLNLRYAMNQVYKGEPHQALNLLRSAESSLDPRNDKTLKIQLMGLELSLRRQIGLPEEDLPQLLEKLTAEAPTGIGRRILERPQENSKLGEDPLGDLFDLCSRKKEDAIGKILELGYLNLLYRVLPLAPGENTLYFGLTPQGLLLTRKGDVTFKEDGVTATLKKMAHLLSQKECTKEFLIQSLWGYEYHPIRHDPLIYRAISRLRHLLGAQANWIEATDNGYRLNPSVRVRFHEAEAQAVAPEAAPPLFHENLNHRQLALLKSLSAETFLDVSAFKKKFKVSQITATRDLAGLVEQSYLRRVGKGRATRYQLIQENP